MLYPTNVTDAQWQMLEKLIPETRRKRKYPIRHIVNGLFYLIKTGCQWRMLPNDFPKWQLVYYYFRKWESEELIDQINQALIEERRVKQGRQRQPSVVIADCQTVKTTMLGGIRGYDGNKKINGHKRHIVVDTQGNIIECLVHSANQHESQTAELLMRKLKEDQFRIKKMIADGGYRGELKETAKKKYNIELEVVKRNEEKAFIIQPKRWVVERTIAWFNGYRRLSKDFERFLETGRAMVFLSSIKLSLNDF